MCYVRQESRCEELCSAFQWCMGYSFGATDSQCNIITLSGGCGHGTNMYNNFEPIAKTFADLIPSHPRNDRKNYGWICMAKTSGKILSKIGFN